MLYPGTLTKLPIYFLQILCLFSYTKHAGFTHHLDDVHFYDKICNHNLYELHRRGKMHALARVFEFAAVNML